MLRDIVIIAACLTWTVAPGVGAEVATPYRGATLVGESSCAILERVELVEDQRLTFSWRNMCGFQVVLYWRSRADDGGLVVGTVAVPPFEIASGGCRRCAFPDWIEGAHEPAPSAARL
jgi:hypothetical protein